MEREESIERIIEVSGGYRQGEIAEFNTQHVERWADQFQTAHQNIILEETAHMLGRFYISRDLAKEKLRRMLRNMHTAAAANCTIREVNFLRTQGREKSQYAMLLIANEILREEYGFGVNDCDGPSVYVYLDDCVYTGNKFLYDIKGSEQLAEAANDFTIISYHTVIYSAGFFYAQSNINAFLRERGIIKPFRSDWYHSDKFGGEPLDIYWPTYVAGNRMIDGTVNRIHDICDLKHYVKKALFRTNQILSTSLFANPAHRQVVEQAFLEAGARMIYAAANPAPSMRPMGFEVIRSIGLGAPTITWRNIANNVPLVYWYGDPNAQPNTALAVWYPLFPRKITPEGD
jgi:hypothetical protein